MVAPVPGTGARYRPFALDPCPLPYDPRTMAPMGCLPGDFNEDGRIDLLVYYWGRTPVVFLRRPGVAALGPERVRAARAGDRRCALVHRRATSADVDGDGHLDLIVGNYFPDGARILDAERDGDPRMQMQHSMSRADNGGTQPRSCSGTRRAAARGRRSRFRDAADALSTSIADGWTLAVGAADLDGDLLPEIYFANDFGPDRLLHNRSTPGHAQLRRAARATTLDHAALEGARPRLVQGHGRRLRRPQRRRHARHRTSATSPSQYALRGEPLRSASARRPPGRCASGSRPVRRPAASRSACRAAAGRWDARLADFDNDGVLEVVQAIGLPAGQRSTAGPSCRSWRWATTSCSHPASAWPRFRPGDDLCGHQHNPFFVRGPAGRYFDIAPKLGLDGRRVSRGIATADVDGDGALDFAVANQWGRLLLLLNRSAAPRPLPRAAPAAPARR